MLTLDRELLEPSDLPLALEAGRMVGRQAVDQVSDPVANLQREVRGRRTHELPHVLNGRLALHAVATFEFAQDSEATSAGFRPAL